MNLTRCENGHFYDADTYNNCPHCEGEVAFDENTSKKKCQNGHFYNHKKYICCPYCDDYHIIEQSLQSLPERFKELGEISLIGYGSNSKVFEIKREKSYALKVVYCGKNEDKYKETVREKQIMEKLKGYNNIVWLYDYDCIDVNGEIICYFLEEYLQPLSDFLNNNLIKASDVIKIITDLCNALSCCKKCGILHLDIHPKNIFVDSQNNIKLGDFGSSLCIDEAGNNQTLRGTLAYLAPEMYRDKICSEKSDVYSLGLVLYALFNKKTLPFMDEDNEEVAIYKRLAGASFPPVKYPNKEVEKQINAIINKACSFSVEDRFNNTLEFKKELQRILEYLDECEKPLLYLDESTNENKLHFFDADSIAFTTALFEDKPRIKNDNTYSVTETLDLKDIIYCPFCNGENQVNANYCVHCGKILVDFLDIQSVEFSALAPKTLVKGEYAILNILMYEKTRRDIVESMIKESDDPVLEYHGGVINVKKQSVIKIVLQSPDIDIEDDTISMVWNGEYLNFAFDVLLPLQFNKRKVLFIAKVFIDNIVTCKLKFTVKSFSLFEQKIHMSREDVLSAFVSYASQDRNRVVSIIQGMKKVCPKMDIFLDVESLRSGDDWKSRLWAEIDKSDIFYLCWSKFACESKWVEAEWKYALKQKGEAFIEPIPIESSESCPPPAELNNKHFNDMLLYVINK